MKPEQQQIAILKAMGWTEDEPWLDGRRCFVRADSNSGWDFNDLPDYLNDLNAMHEAEKVLLISSFMWETYSEILATISDCNEYEPFAATATQRAKALLKTIGKWEGGSDELQG